MVDAFDELPSQGVVRDVVQSLQLDLVADGPHQSHAFSVFEEV